MLELIYDPQAWLALATLTVMEIVLGIDNIVFISLIVAKLNGAQAKTARQLGLFLALIFRILLLMALAWLIGLTKPLFEMFDQQVSWRDIILASGGLFLIYKGTAEIHEAFEHEDDANGTKNAKTISFTSVVAQIIVIDMVFSVDSIITAIGMAQDVEVMIAAVIIAVGVMYLASGAISTFIENNPTTKMLALSFLLLIGISLVADGFGYHIPRGFIYFAMVFSAMVEVFNILAGRRRKSS